MVTEASQIALDNLRDTGNLQWYVIPLIVFVIFIYRNEIEKGNQAEVYGGIIWFCFAGVFLEIINALVLHFTGYSALWTTPDKSAFVIYVGWNIEIAIIAALFGIHNTKSIPKDPKKKILGIPNLIFSAIIGGIINTCIELILNWSGLLVWDYWWWSWPNIYFIVLWWIWPSLLFSWFQIKSSLETKKKVAIISVISAVACHIVFATILGWV